MPLKTRPYDAAEFLVSDTDVQLYLEAAFEEGDPVLIRAAFADVARARGMTALAKEAGVSRETLYKAFSEDGNPTLDTLLKVTKALGVRLAVAA
jgi:probable addiction module antidote protein